MRAEERHNDVLERLLGIDGERDRLAGFGRWSDDHADRVREARRAFEAKRRAAFGDRTREG